MRKSKLLNIERNSLSRYAAKSDSLALIKRCQNENSSNNDSLEVRLPFQRDRDRIVHSRAFRRLMHKTQVFNANMGDHYRNRLTHTLEVSQIGRSIGKFLGLNEELIEAIALGHDLGHTPFGHVGERTLHLIISENKKFLDKYDIDLKAQCSCTKIDGFKHNFQGLHIVDNIEKRSKSYTALNLTWAVRDGILKHTGLKIRIPREYMEEEEKEEVSYSTLYMTTKREVAATLEGQVVAIADEIAQCTHDLEDGIRSGIIKIGDLKEDRLIQKIIEERDLDESDFNTTVDIRNELIRHMVGYLIKDVCKKSQKKLGRIRIGEYPKYSSKKDVWNEEIIRFSKKTNIMRGDLANLITDMAVNSQSVSQSDSKAEYIIVKLFKAYFSKPQQLPDYILNRYFEERNPDPVIRKRSEIMNSIKKLQRDKRFIRLICDHISGMTDQYAAREYKKLYEAEFF